MVLTGGLDSAVPGDTVVLRRRQHPDAGRARRTATRSTSASSPTRRATPSRTPPPTPGRRGSPPSTARPPAAATSWRWPATRSSSSTTGPRRSRSPRCRCSPCCPVPVASPGSSTSVTSAVTSPTCSPRGPRASRASRPSTGDSSTPSRHAAASTTSSDARALRASRRVGPTRRRDRRRPHAARTPNPPATSCATSTSTSPSTAASVRRTSPCAGRPRPQPSTPDELVAAGAEAWLLAAARQLDDAVLHLRFNEPELGTWILRTEGSADAVVAAEAVLADDHWLAQGGPPVLGRTLKRLDLSARTLVALVEPGSCFAGTLAELALVADRTLMLDGTREDVELAGRRPCGSPPPTTAGTRWRTACPAWRPASGVATRASSAPAT